MPTLVLKEEKELMEVGETLLLEARKHTPPGTATVLALRGDLGAGKTALTKALARTLGVVETVTSPTFVIMKMYPLPVHEHFDTLVHIDAYRIEDVDELRVIQFDELLNNPRNLIVIEWPERVSGVVPLSALQVQIEMGKDNERIFTYGK
jgi:tRNA threonylcarbamoyladenosine biosynthesis protein TsaE